MLEEILEQTKKSKTDIKHFDKLVTYYLPTITKLVECYADLSKRTFLGENATMMQKNIEVEVQHFNEFLQEYLNKHLDIVLQDVYGEISAFEAMMVQSGLRKPIYDIPLKKI